MEGLKNRTQWPTRSSARLVYPRLLAGGAIPLRLPIGCGFAIFGCGLAASLLGARASLVGPQQTPWLAVAAWTIGNAFAGVVLAAFAARWLGPRTGTLAGLIHASGLHVLLPDRQYWAGSLASLAACAAIGAFASAEVPGRVPAENRPMCFAAFCVATGAAAVIAGIAGPVCILAVCLAYVALFQDGRGLGFFTARYGYAILAIAIAAGCLVARSFGESAGHSLDIVGQAEGAVPIADPASLVAGATAACAGLLPWTPFVLVAIGLGLRQGHYAAPLGRLLCAWLAAPWLLWASGIMHLRLAFAVVSPCAALMAASGISESLAWLRRRLRRPIL